MRVDRYSAVVTGGSSEISIDVARRVLARGGRVALLDLGTMADHPLRGHDDAHLYTADVTDEAQVAAALEDFGGVPDLLVNAAALIRFGAMHDQTPESFRKVIDVNVCGTLIPSLLVARGMAARGSGAIVNITSINALNPGPGTGAYPASKAAVAKLSEHMALEWGPLGIRVNALAPGFIDCGMSAVVYADPVIRAERSKGVPVQRLGVPADIAAAILFLASDEAAYIHGHHLVVDGGVTPSLLSHLRRESPTAAPAPGESS
jgi:NAD(P)-dependent dehydrogenase (short-subunit alcohol dehydrogenase family)